MKMYIHSSYGVHECTPMEQQDITIVQAKDNQLSETLCELVKTEDKPQENPEE